MNSRNRNGKSQFTTILDQRTLRADILEGENGDFSYELGNLQPETCYEMKVCSVDNHVKSQYTEYKTNQTLVAAPTNFKIAGVSDRSITISWIKNDVECQEYQLVHGIQGTDDKTVLTLFSKDISEEDNYVYELEKLRPETSYELKLCSVDNYVKRKESGGKTCLLRRLLKDSIDGVTSTDGVDICVGRCKINIQDGKWTIDKKQIAQMRHLNLLSEANSHFPFDTVRRAESGTFLIDKNDAEEGKIIQIDNKTKVMSIFWFDTIHCQRTVDLPVNAKINYYIDPPVIIVFTGKDKYNDQTILMRNLNGCDKKYQKTAQNMKNWGECMPLKWILLEYVIEINEEGRNFITFSDIAKMAKHPEIDIQNTEDVLLFLRYQHEVGNLIFFDEIQDLIILNPQWLVDAFRCLVSDKFDATIQHSDDWTTFENTGKSAIF
ncbi:unnamed protein product [Mytilus edulis]|uniref:Fibronectin type-III domain-containing protein n=1 Tax=Mytilus edulis TaxID=6550 RepID=A0A8S3R9U5_MYTED|nr:unnamed protein product [Mytilus edulis]